MTVRDVLVLVNAAMPTVPIRSGRATLSIVAAAGVLAASVWVLPWLGGSGAPPVVQAQREPWTPVMDGLYGDIVTDLILTGRPPQAGRSMLLLPEGRGLYIVDDYGEGWHAVRAHPDRAHAPVYAATVGGDDPDGRLVYAGLQGRLRVARSLDGGRTWMVTAGPTSLDRVDRLTSSTPSGRVYAAQTDRIGLFASEDRGDNWVTHPLPGSSGRVESLFAAPDEPHVYLQRSGALYRSNDDPSAWRLVIGPVPTAPVTVALTTDFAAVGPRGRLYAVGLSGAEYRVYASVTRGDSWSTYGWPTDAEGAKPAALGAGEIRPTQPAVWLALDDGRVFESQDGAVTWEHIATMPILPTRVVVDPATYEVWVGTEGLGLFRVKPAPPVHTGAVPVEALAVEVTETVSGSLALLLGQILPERRDEAGAILPPLHGLYASSDGEHWSQRLMTESLGSRLYASPDFTSTARLFTDRRVSRDGGLTWSSLGAVPGRDVPAVVAMGPLTGTEPVLYGLEEPYVGIDTGAGLVLSLDGGATWEEAETAQRGIVSVVVSPEFPRDRTAYFATERGQIYRATDGILFGAVGRVPAAAPLVRTVYDLVISPDFARDQVLVAAVDDPADLAQHAKVFLSNTGGASWQSRNADLLTTSHPRRLVLSPTFKTDRLIFLGGARADDEPDLPTIYGSESAGAEWFMEAFWPPSIVHDFAWQGDTEEGRLFAAAGEAGLWARDLAEPIVNVRPSPTPSPTRTVAPTRTPTHTPTVGPTACTSCTPTPTVDPDGTVTAPTPTTTPQSTEIVTGTITVTAETPTVPPSETVPPTETVEPPETPTDTPTPSPVPDATLSATPSRTPMPGGRVYLPFATRITRR